MRLKFFGHTSSSSVVLLVVMSTQFFRLGSKKFGPRPSLLSPDALTTGYFFDHWNRKMVELVFYIGKWSKNPFSPAKRSQILTKTWEITVSLKEPHKILPNLRKRNPFKALKLSWSPLWGPFASSFYLALLDKPPTLMWSTVALFSRFTFVKKVSQKRSLQQWPSSWKKIFGSLRSFYSPPPITDPLPPKHTCSPKNRKIL